jgi:hypothetical protein
MKINKLLLGLVLGIVALAAPLFLSGINPVYADTVTATLTADNHYALYYGDANGNNLTYVGRNEDSVIGNPGQYNWSLPETWNINVPVGKYLFVLAWDDGGPQSWIGEFTLPGNKKLYSTLTDWQFMVATGFNPGGPPATNFPSLATVQNDITTGTWAAPLASAVNGTGPWGTIPGISASAKFIWHDTLNDSSTSDAHYAIFRTNEAVVVPIPPSALLLGSGLLGLGAVGWRRRKV